MTRAEEVAEKTRDIIMNGFGEEMKSRKESIDIIAAALEAYAKEKVEEALQKRCLAKEAKSSQREADAVIALGHQCGINCDDNSSNCCGAEISRRIRESGDGKSALADDPK